MSQNTIFERSQEIRNETEQFANTRGRVANVLDDINETKANKVDVDLAILGLRTDLDLLSGYVAELQEADVQHELELEALRQKDILQDGAIQTLFNNDITLSNQISQEILDRQAGDDALTTAVGFKLDKPTALADGSYALVKTGAAFSWESTATLGKNIFNSNLTLDADRTQNLGAKKLTFTGGRFSVPTLEMEITSSNSVPNKIWTGGVGLWFTDASGVQKRVMTGTVFTYTPTGDFTLSTIKIALEATGMIFNDSHIIVNLGSNNYSCSIDIGATNPNTIITIGKRGNGSISFNSARTLISGADSITIMNGNEGSMSKLEFGASVDFLTVRNL